MARSTNRVSEFKPTGKADDDSYILEFLTDSKDHPAGSSMTIKSHYITFGRDEACDIHFDANQSLVSRTHAAIEKRIDKMILLHLSDTNQTLLNGRPVNQEWSLQSGDEIQLSPNGPRIRFLVAPVKPVSLGLTKRIQIFSQQALKPYKRAIVILLALFLLIIVIGVFVIREMRTKNTMLTNAYAEINKQTEEHKQALRRGDSLFIANQKSTTEKLAENNRQKEKISRELNDLKASIKKLQEKTVPASVIPAITITSTSKPLLKMIDDVKDQIYFLKVFLTIKGQLNREDVGSGTGIMLKDGRFVTTRQCVQPWVFADIDAVDKFKEQWLLINWLYNNSPKGDVRVDIEVMSTDGKRIYLSGDKFIVNENRDAVYNIDVGYGRGKIQLISEPSTDWAFIKVNDAPATGIEPGFQESAVIEPGATLHFISYAKEVEDGREQILPKHFELRAPVKEPGHGLLKVLDIDFREGNSGSPVFFEKDNRLVLIGILSFQDNQGVVVPIHVLNNQ
jgi:hypothetical protein